MVMSSARWCPVVASSGGRVIWEDRALFTKLKMMNLKADRALTAATAYHATKAAAYAKQNAPWTDRTGNARNGLFATAQRDYPSYRIIIGHSVDYGVWLEARFSGRYQIIRPTVDNTGPELMKTVSKLFEVIL